MDCLITSIYIDCIYYMWFDLNTDYRHWLTKKVMIFSYMLNTLLYLFMYIFESLGTILTSQIKSV